jgi:hypothetical protein
MIRSITKSKETNPVPAGCSDIVTAESMCQRNKLCTKTISLVPLHRQTDPFISPYKRHIVIRNKQYSYILSVTGSAWFFLHKTEFSLANQWSTVKRKEYYLEFKGNTV